MAVPMTVKMPEPMTAPIPRAVSDQGPRDFFSACSGSSDSLISLSMDLQANSWLGRVVLLRSLKVPAAVRKLFGEVYMVGKGVWNRRRAEDGEERGRICAETEPGRHIGGGPEDFGDAACVL